MALISRSLMLSNKIISHWLLASKPSLGLRKGMVVDIDATTNTRWLPPRGGGDG